MRITFQPWLSALVIVLLCGCASVSKGPTYAETRTTTQLTNKATVYVYRKNAEPKLWPVNVHFGSFEVATLNQGNFTWVNLTPGKHLIRSAWSGLSGQQDASIEIEVEPATKYYLEVTGISRGASVPFRISSEINKVSPQAAEADLATCCTFRKSIAAGTR